MDYVCANIMRVMRAEGAAEVGIALAALERMHDAEEEHEAQQDAQAAPASQRQQHEPVVDLLGLDMPQPQVETVAAAASAELRPSQAKLAHKSEDEVSAFRAMIYSLGSHAQLRPAAHEVAAFTLYLA